MKVHSVDDFGNIKSKASEPIWPVQRWDPLAVIWHFVCITVLQLLVLGRASDLLGVQLGDFVYLYAIENVALTLTLLGLHATAMRFLSIASSRGHTQACVGILVRCFALRAVLVSVVAVGLYGYLTLYMEVAYRTAAAVCVMLVLHGLLLLQHACLQGLGRYGRLAMSSTFLPLGALLPATDLASFFWMFVLAFGMSLGVNALSLSTGWSGHRSASNSTTGFGNLLSFSGILSVGGILVIASENTGILLLKGAYEPVAYSVVVLALQLAIYPGRINALSEALILPQFSAAFHGRPSGRATALFQGWLRLLHVSGLILVPLLILLIDPLFKLFFSEHLQNAIPLLSLLLVGLLARLIFPAALAVLIGAGRPGLTVLLHSGKLVVDLTVVVLLAGQGDLRWLMVALVGSYLLYGQCAYLLARRELALPLRPDWVVLVSTVFLGIVVWSSAALLVLLLMFASSLIYVFFSWRRLFTAVV